MADELIYFNQSDYQTARRNWDVMAGYVQTAIDFYNTMGLPALSSNSELYALFADPTSFIWDKMTGGQNVVLGGLTLIKDKAMDIVAKPANYDAFLGVLKQVKENLLQGVGYGNTRAGVGAASLSGHIELNQQGRAIVSSNIDTRLNNMHSHFAKTANAKKVLAFVKAVQQSYSDLQLYGIGGEVNVSMIIGESFDRPSSYVSSQTLTINPVGIEKYNI